MRLTCPRCAAQYEIADSAIPPAGREVECSSCGRIWHQPAPGRAEVGAAPTQAGFDPSARPALNQPLDESVLSILREETARELRARQGGGRPDTDAAPADEAGADHIPATRAAIAEAEAIPAPPPAPTPIHPPAAPAATVAGAESGGEEPAQDGPAVTGMAEPPAPDLPASGAAEPTKDAARSEAAAEQPRDPPRPVLPHLPDAVELAATLTRPGPHRPAPAPATPAVPPETRPLIAEATAPPPEPAPTALPVPTPPPGRGGYALGFGLAVALALALIATYALTPSAELGAEAGPLASLKQEIDRGRLWLHDRIAGEKP